MYEEKLAMAYMVKGETKFDMLKCLFQDSDDSICRVGDHEIIEGSSDHEDVGISDADKELIILVDGDAREDNTNNSFWNELVWYASDSVSEASLFELEEPSHLSTTDEVVSKLKKMIPKTMPKNCCPSVDPPSSSGSNSPFKKN